MRGARGGDGRERVGDESFLPLRGARSLVDSLIEGCLVAAVFVLLDCGPFFALSVGLAFAIPRALQRVADARGWTLLAVVCDWPSRGFGLDGVYMGGDDGDLFEVYDPPWWRFDRWYRWLFAEGHRRAIMRVRRGDDEAEVRAMSVRYDPPSPRRRYVAP